MSFRTKIDFSGNRQINQYIETRTNLSGATQFGVLFSQLPTGANPAISGTSLIGNNLVSTFSGNSATTVFTWYDNRMELGHSRLSAITPSNSATTQQTGDVYTGDSSTIIDGNSLFLTYSGISFDVSTIAIFDLGGGNYSGTVNSVNVYLLTASTLDFTGRTIWVDVSGITRTNDLIISKTPNIGYVWTCINTEGLGYWAALGTGTTNYWSASTGGSIFGIVQNHSEAIALGTLGVAEGYKTNANGNYSHAEGSGTTAGGVTSHAEGRGSTASGIASHSEGRNTIANGASSHAEGTNTIADGIASHAEGYNSTASGDGSHAGGSGSTASGITSFIHSINSIVIGDRSVVLGGQNITGSTSDTVYVPYLNISYSGTPSSSGDTLGTIGAVRWDNNYLYLKTLSGWGRTLLSYAF